MDTNQEVYFKDIRKHIIRNINEAQVEISIAVAWFTDEYIIQSLVDARQRNVIVKVVLYDDRVNRKELFRDLFFDGAEVWLSNKLMHNKFCIIDDYIVINGSYNWTYNAASNDENIQITRGNKNLCKSFYEQFINLKSNCKRIDSFFKGEEEKFQDYYQKKRTHSDFPYFLKFPGESRSQAFYEGKYYLITDREEELLFHRLSYNNIIMGDKLKYLKVNIRSELIFDNVIYDSASGFIPFKDQTMLVEKKETEQYQAHIINKIGQKIKSVYYYKRLPNGYYLRIDKLFDKELNDIAPPCDKMESLSYGLLLFKKVFDTSSHYFNELRGVADFYGNLLIPIVYHRINYLNEENLELLSLPIFYMGDDWAKVKENPRKHYRDWEIAFFDDIYPVKKYYDYSFKDNSITPRDSSKHHVSNRRTFYYIFCADNPEDFNFYKAIMSLYHSGGVTVGVYHKLFDEYKKNKLEHLSVEDLVVIIKERKPSFEKELEKSKSCYIATMVYEDINHPKVQILRNYRDRCLRKNLFGRIFIRIYYTLSPNMVKFAKNHKLLQSLLRSLVIKIVYFVEKTQLKA